MASSLRIVSVERLSERLLKLVSLRKYVLGESWDSGALRAIESWLQTQLVFQRLV